MIQTTFLTAMIRTSVLAACLVPLVGRACVAQDDRPKPIRVMFLGDNGHHLPAERFGWLQGVLAKQGIALDYSDRTEDLAKEVLDNYAGLLIYANTTRISAGQEQVLLDYVEGGKGLIAVHCASYCFLNSPRYVALVGAQFKEHGFATVRTTIAAADHPVMAGFRGFESPDETYVHTKHNEQDRTVLEYRAQRGQREPWTWVRTQGKGRVFYTAWGHDHRTWDHPGFHNLLERGIRWAVGDDPSRAGGFAASSFDSSFPIPQTSANRSDVQPFQYADVGKKIPNYTPNRQWGTQGEPLSKMQLPLPPEESIKHFVTPQGFHVELFASEEQFAGGKPICMTWDMRGRLWAGLTVDYPNNLQTSGQGRDRVVICEDSDGDGRADRVTQFADRLSIPSSIAFHEGGVIVQNAARTLFLEDTDGDDHADRRRVLFDGWGMGDTHGGVSNFQYGLDNWIWAMQGYNQSRPVVAGQAQQSFRQGFFRFKPDGSALEFLRSTNNNTWGLGISEEGIVFGSTANRNPSVHLPIPNRYYESVRGWTPALVLGSIADTHLFKPITENVRQVDHHGGYTAGAGHALYTARRYPQEYWNGAAFVCGPTGHLVGTFVLRRDGSSFKSSNSFNLLASDDEWTAPIMAEVGPDGNVWVIDWYNYIVQHNPTPRGFQTGRGAAYETDLRDKTHGRIYRVVYERPGHDEKPITLAGAEPETLVATLSHDNLLWRRHAQRLLVERGKQDVLPALLKLAGNDSVDAIGLNVGMIHALWTLHGLGALEGSNGAATTAAVHALGHASAGVRRNAVQVLPHNEASVEAILEAGLLRDSDPQVRLAALLALADRPATPAAGVAVAEALADSRNATEPWLRDAATAAAAKDDVHFLAALAAKKRTTQSAWQTAAIVAEHYARGRPTGTVGPLIARLAGGDAQVGESVVRGLASGWPANAPPALDERIEQDLQRLAGRLSPQRRALLIKLAIGWGSKRFARQAAELRGLLLQQVQDESVPVEQRAAAAREFAALSAKETNVVPDLLVLITPRTPPLLAQGILGAVQMSEVPGAGQVILRHLERFTPATRASALALLLERMEWTSSLLESAAAGKVLLSDLSLDQRQALSNHPDGRIRTQARQLLERGGVLPNADRQKVIDKLLGLTQQTGDAAAGKEVFKKHCATCHTHAGEGNTVGPDLTGMAAHPKEHLLSEIIDPNRSVEANFRTYTLVTAAGRVLSGLLAAESRTALELFDAEGEKHTVLREEVEELVASQKSLMPEGFEQQIKPDELADLLEFLTHRGKYVPLPLDKVATVVSTRGMFYSRSARAERLVFDQWGAKSFEGVPFLLVDPQGDRAKNVVLLYGPQGSIPPQMPKAVSLRCDMPVAAVHLLSGVSGWGHPLGRMGSVTLIVRLHYGDGATEEHVLKNGEHFADYIRRVDVPGSQFAFNLRGRQVRYLAVRPERTAPIKQIDLVKGPDDAAPIVMAVTLEAIAGGD